MVCSTRYCLRNSYLPAGQVLAQRLRPLLPTSRRWGTGDDPTLIDDVVARWLKPRYGTYGYAEVLLSAKKLITPTTANPKPAAIHPARSPKR